MSPTASAEPSRPVIDNPYRVIPDGPLVIDLSPEAVAERRAQPPEPEPIPFSDLDKYILDKEPEPDLEWIANRLRSGELSRRRASLAAFLGDEAAAAALGQIDEPQPEPAGTVDAYRDVRRWLREVGTYGQDVAVRVALALAQPALETVVLAGEREAGRMALDTAAQWLRQPSDGMQIACQRAGDLATTTAADARPSIGPRPASYHALTACGLAMRRFAK